MVSRELARVELQRPIDLGLGAVPGGADCALEPGDALGLGGQRADVEWLLGSHESTYRRHWRGPCHSCRVPPRRVCETWGMAQSRRLRASTALAPPKPKQLE